MPMRGCGKNFALLVVKTESATRGCDEITPLLKV